MNPLLPLRNRRWTYGWTLVLLAYYLATMTRGLSLYDSPELALVGEQFGLGHPIGQPLHTIVAHLFSRIALFFNVDPLIAMNALSAIAGALTLPAVCSIGESLIDEDIQHAHATRWLAPATALAATHVALWEPATRIEVYTLATCLGMFGVARLVHVFGFKHSPVKNHWLTGLLFGLSAATHAHIGVAFAIACGPRCLLAVYRKETATTTPLKIIAGGLTGLLFYLYIPWAAQNAGDALIWGQPDDWKSLRHYFSGADYAKNRTITLQLFGEHLIEWLKWSFRKGHLIFLLVGFIGYARFAKQRGIGRFLFWVTLTYLLGQVLANAIFAPDILDYLEYLLPVFWISALGIGLMVVLGARKNSLIGVATFVLAATLVGFWPPSPLHRTRHLDNATEELATAALDAAPKNAILIVEHDHWAAPLWYVQEQRNVRADVTVIAYGLGSSSWYWAHILRRHPDLNPFELLGPGGKNARIDRLQTANRGRPLLVETTSLAARLKKRGCVGAYFVHVTKRCTPTKYPTELEASIHTLVASLRDGSPGTLDMLTLIAMHRGIDRARAGQPRAAVRVLLATDDPAYGSTAHVDDEFPARSRPLNIGVPNFARPVALGSIERNLFIAASIARAVGQDGFADRWSFRSASLASSSDQQPRSRQ